MDERVALVTGGLGGLGTEISRQLAKDGNRVIASYYRNGDHKSAQKWLEAQKKIGLDIEIIYCDVKDYDSCESMVTQIQERFGRVDLLVNNAGITNDKCLKKMSLEQWHEVISTNLNSVFHVTRQVINGMLDNNFGRIINIGSINGQKGQFGQTNYAASKAGIHGFTMSLAQEVISKGVTVNTISPGYLDTEMVTSLSKDILDAIIQQIPAKRLGKVEEVARLVVFLSREENGFITGANLAINGGQFIS